MREYLEKGYYIRTVPSYIAQRCLDRKSTAVDCKVCSEICPKGIYPTGKRKRPIYDQCIKCNLCAANCPARCITPVSGEVERFLMAVEGKTHFSVGCNREDNEYSLNVGCLASISWEQLAYAALKNGVTVSLRECAGCDNEKKISLVNENLNKLLEFLGDELFDKRVKILYPGDEYELQPETVSRRQLFNFFNNNTLDKVFKVLPELDNSADSPLFFRYMLRDAVREFKKSPDGENSKFTMGMPLVNSKCYACGTCVNSCPTKAISIINKEDTFTFAVEVFKCTQCGVCKEKCWTKAIDKIAPMKVSHLGKVAVAKLKQHRCPQCGKNFSYETGSELCPLCAAKKRVADRKKAQAEQTD